MDDFNKKYPLIDKLNVSRETCLEFETFASMVSEKNHLMVFNKSDFESQEST